ncbi:MAG: hypothetical protein A3G59_00495 [Candidatus Taylorbacteria bacterium RIFCSPLOWO2_12_FULL_47_20]|uniref:Uncharacterized protein n=2 Tax=Candidatus Tayloriibacteriota TaxID=1817919 RepID=A0A1G2P6N2_9BACT|nr:MAG: hypothetical protein A3H68_01890 [Candidatus Taylorbacteria bacterium RIFCSPLOWO2_02_FULL_46_40]OHA43221.1 MAG: hypothetical protein A3G59_00495 [Candidatus Taylorbacteria bacterium RIFCSPLOWO2_12_FULL_47_20]
MRGEAKLKRTLGESPTHWRVRQQPRKKNTPRISDLAGVKFLLKKERVFFFRCSALNSSGGRGFRIIGRRAGRRVWEECPRCPRLVELRRKLLRNN